jgi:hypothetical protein
MSLVAGSRIRTEKKWILLAIAAAGLVGTALAQYDESPSAFNGVWRNADSDETLTIIIEGTTAFIRNSNNARGTGTFNGETIEYSGKVKTDEGLVQTVGTFKLGDDNNSLIKRRQIQYASGTVEETTNYTRVVSSSSTSTSTSTPTATPIPSPTPTHTPSSPFAGVWAPADDSSKLTITVSGRNAILKYSRGSRDTGTVRGTKIECQSTSTSDGIQSTDVFEMSSNSRTLIRRRTLESPKGEIGHETLTYNRTE